MWFYNRSDATLMIGLRLLPANATQSTQTTWPWGGALSLLCTVPPQSDRPPPSPVTVSVLSARLNMGWILRDVLCLKCIAWRSRTRSVLRGPYSYDVCSGLGRSINPECRINDTTAAVECTVSQFLNYSKARLLICVYPSQKLNNKQGFWHLNN